MKFSLTDLEKCDQLFVGFAFLACFPLESLPLIFSPCRLEVPDPTPATGLMVWTQAQANPCKSILLATRHQSKDGNLTQVVS